MQPFIPQSGAVAKSYDRQERPQEALNKLLSVFILLRIQMTYKRK